MPAFSNIGFETAGAVAALANAWFVESKGGHQAAEFGIVNAHLLPSVSALETADWTRTNVTVATNVATAPDGTSSVDQLTDDAVNGFHGVKSNTVVALSANVPYRFRTHLKSGTHRYVLVYVDFVASGTLQVFVDLQTKKIILPSSSAPPAGTKLSATLVEVEQGFVEVTLFLLVTSAISAEFFVLMSTSGGATSYIGTGTTVLVWETSLRQADYGTSYDAFLDGWNTTGYLASFTGPNLSAGAFDTAPGPTELFEDFEEYWLGNQGYLSSFSLAASATFDSGGTPESMEDFEELWLNNQTYVTSMGATTSAVFDPANPENMEDFEEYWLNNGSYQFVLGATTAASFDSGGVAEPVEDFEEVKLKTGPCAVAPGANTLTFVGHGFVANDRVTVAVENGEMSGGLQPNTTYWVIFVNANTVQLSNTAGPGAAVAITTSGSGSIYLIADKSRFWTTSLD